MYLLWLSCKSDKIQWFMEVIVQYQIERNYLRYIRFIRWSMDEWYLCCVPCKDFSIDSKNEYNWQNLGVILVFNVLPNILYKRSDLIVMYDLCEVYHWVDSKEILRKNGFSVSSSYVSMMDVRRTEPDSLKCAMRYYYYC